ncbi:unnamed protein product [Peniophora sp. CBMAI 1063]|nr:unnamed protein product [Peniophora sp. CBMAI 1063]
MPANSDNEACRVPRDISTVQASTGAPIQNRSLPIYIDALPLELLCRIFCWMRHLEDPEAGITLHARTPPWTPVLHVCSSWRAAALECKALWSIIPLGNPKWTEMALQLSDPVDIALYMPDGPRLYMDSDHPAPTKDHVVRQAVALTFPHLSRASVFELSLIPHEESREDGGPFHTFYLRARAFFAPLRNARMDRLRDLYCKGGDLTDGSFLGIEWPRSVCCVQMMWVRFTKNLTFLSLPLTNLEIIMPDFRGSFEEFLTVVNSCKELTRLDIEDHINSSRYHELFGPDSEPTRSSLPTVDLPSLETLTLSGSPLLISAYLPQFALQSRTTVLASWWAHYYQAPGAAQLPDQLHIFKMWPLVETFGFEPTMDQRMTWLAQLCLAVAHQIHRVIAADAVGSKHFDPSSFKFHPLTQEEDDWLPITINYIQWEPENSAIRLSHGGSDGTRYVHRSVFGVSTSVGKGPGRGWTAAFNSMRRRGEHDAYAASYTAPAAFTFPGAGSPSPRPVDADQPFLTLIALDRIDQTTPYMKTYFPVIKRLLRPEPRSPDEPRTMPCTVHVLFPFGLELDDEQRESLQAFNIRMSDVDTEYPYTEYY